MEQKGHATSDLSMRMHYWHYKEYFPVIGTDTALDKHVAQII